MRRGPSGRSGSRPGDPDGIPAPRPIEDENFSITLRDASGLEVFSASTADENSSPSMLA